MNKRENESRKSHQAGRGLQVLRMELKDDNGEGLDWLNPFACREASELYSGYTAKGPSVNGKNVDPYIAGGDERYYT